MILKSPRSIDALLGWDNLMIDRKDAPPHVTLEYVMRWASTIDDETHRREWLDPAGPTQNDHGQHK